MFFTYMLLINSIPPLYRKHVFGTDGSVLDYENALGATNGKCNDSKSKIVAM